MDRFYLGASYYPEWWTEREWEEDFSKMEALGFNVVRMGEFAWSWYEPQDGVFRFAPMRRAMDCAHKHGISVILGTTTAVCPPWLYKKCPSVKGGNTHGVYDFGGRKGQCLSNEVFLRYAKRITEEQAKALGDHPALIGWQLDNEPGFPFHDFDPCCTAGFRQWLREKYGTIDALNQAWFTMMWSNVYNDFDEIDIPVNASEGGWTAQIQLDYRRYFSFTFNRLLRMESEILRKYSPGCFLYTNWPGANWSVDCFEGSTYLDYAAWDNYVGQPYGEQYRIQLRASMEHSFDRRLSCGKHAFLVAEQKGCVNANGCADVIRAQTWLNVSHGAFGTIFFEWRSPTGGFEQAYDSILGRDKQFRADTEPVLRRLSAELQTHYSKIADAETQSDIAVLYSYENSWGSPGWIVDGPYDEEIFNAYGGFKNALRTDVDIVGMQDDLQKYRVLVLPNHRMTTEAEAEKIRAFVENGGIAVLNTHCGTRDSSNQMRELLQPGLFAPLCGAEATAEIAAERLETETGQPSCIRYENGNTVRLHGLLHRLRLCGAEPLAVYTSGKLAGTPAITMHKVGKGYAVLFACDSNDVFFYEALAEALRTRFDLPPLLDVEDGILVSSRIKGKTRFLFAVNMKDTPCKVHLPHPMTDILQSKTVCGEVTVAAYDILFLQD